MPKKPTIVALVPAFNAGVHLRASVNSLVEQTLRPDQIVVIDDGSTDSSIDSIRDFESKGLVVISPNSMNRGRAWSMNKRFSQIDADYFVIQDADDVALPERVEKQVAFMEKNSGVGCSSSFIRYINSNGRVMGRGILDLTSDSRLDEYLAGGEPFGLFCPAVIIRAEVVKNPELQFRSEFWPADDIDLWNRIAEAGWRVIAQQEILVEYRVHPGSIVTGSYTRTRMQFEWVRCCLRARRRNEQEPSRDEFLKEWENAPVFRKIDRWRKTRAKALYRTAGFLRGENRLGRAAGLLVGAAALQPNYVLRRLLSQFNSR
jgi:glycosyltransferase involved in cell wall biosynthesis